MAAAMETGFCALALRHGFIPGQAHLAMPDPACEGLHLPATTIPRGPDIVVKNSSGFGGSNVTLVLQRWSD
jgi:3-oxoacyl-(acyl-carrier-protein) synthase